ncbi:MAG: hypothetical protein KF724_03375 [Phycisphaeraceae bacterium]|nr:hypothetical protein [Phycisphaeraceae bacterium]
MSPRVRLTSGVRWSGPVIVGLVTVVVIAGVSLAGVLRLAGAAAGPRVDSRETSAFDALLATHDETAKLHRERFEGRSLFFIPIRPADPTPPPPPPPPQRDERPPPPPPEPAPPAEYTGPKVIACIGNMVFFADSMQLGKGEERSGVRVVSTNPPWSVTLHHLKKDYVVSILPDSNESFFGGSLSTISPSSNPGMELMSAPSPRPVAGRATATPTPSAPAVRGDQPPEPRPGDFPGDAAVGDPPASEQEPPLDGGPPVASPPAPSDAPSGAPPSASSESGPPPLTKEEIDAMDRDAVSKAMMAVSRARLNRNLDEATRSRLAQELAWLQARMNQLRR